MKLPSIDRHTRNANTCHSSTLTPVLIIHSPPPTHLSNLRNQRTQRRLRLRRPNRRPHRPSLPTPPSPQMPPYLPRRRVVVTSIGAISPLGPTFSTTWSNLLNFTSPIKSVDALSSLPCTVAAAASIPDSSPSNVTSQKSRFLQFAISATNDALSTYTSSIGGITHGISLGSGIGSISTITAAHTLLTTKSHKRLSPHFVPSILSNSSAGVVSKEFNLQGPNTSCSTACATGNHSIIDAYRFIRDGEADLMVAGGSEASIDELSVAGFTRLRALSTGFNDRPEEVRI